MGQRSAFFTSQGSEVINIMVDPSNKMLGPKAKVATRRIWIRRIQCFLLSGMIQTRAWKLGRPFPTVLFILTYCFKFFALNFLSITLLSLSTITHKTDTHTHIYKLDGDMGDAQRLVLLRAYDVCYVYVAYVCTGTSYNTQYRKMLLVLVTYGKREVWRGVGYIMILLWYR